MKERGFRHVRGVVCLGQATPKRISDGAHYTNKKELVKYWYVVRWLSRLLGSRSGLFCAPAINWRIQPRAADIV